MRYIYFGLLLLLPYQTMGVITQTSPSIQACFTPPRGCTDFILKAIHKAQKSIYVQAYSFTSPILARGLTQAFERGVNVQVILDKSQKTDVRSRLSQITAHKIPVFIDHISGIAHNKVMIIDEEWVITGSFNFTQSAERRNAENVLIIRDKNLAEQYLKNWYKRLAHSYAANIEYYRAGKYFGTLINDMVEYIRNLLVDYNLDKVL